MPAKDGLACWKFSTSTSEQTEKPTINYVLYPKTKEGEFISLSLMQFNDVINKSKSWDGKTPYLGENELFMNKDLTENDLIIRQINASKIIDRLLRH